MTTVYLSRELTGPLGEPVEIELEAELSGDGEAIGLRRVVTGWSSVAPILGYVPIPDWALRQLDMGDLTEDVRQKLRAMEMNYP